MAVSRPLIALALAALLLQAAVLFRWHDMQRAVPQIRSTLMPAPIAASRAEIRHARALCFSDQPVWEKGRTQMDFCQTAAAAGDARAQAIVAGFSQNDGSRTRRLTSAFW